MAPTHSGQEITAADAGAAIRRSKRPRHFTAAVELALDSLDNQDRHSRPNY